MAMRLEPAYYAREEYPPPHYYQSAYHPHHYPPSSSSWGTPYSAHHPPRVEVRRYTVRMTAQERCITGMLEMYKEISNAGVLDLLHKQGFVDETKRECNLTLRRMEEAQILVSLRDKGKTYWSLAPNTKVIRGKHASPAQAQDALKRGEPRTTSGGKEV